MKKSNLNIFLGGATALFLLLVLSFGSTLPWLGYGFDEWHFIYYSTRGSTGLFELFHYDGHPQATWAFIQSINLLGYRPLVWHIYSLIWRWLAVIFLWLCLTRVWPGNHRQNFYMAAVFAIHPIFTLQVFPISYFEIWISYVLLFLSFLFSILAVQFQERRNYFMVLAVLLAAGHVFTREYTWFVELMRPVFIWLVLPSGQPLKEKISRTIKNWFPMFLIFFASMIWRGFFYTPLRKYFQVQTGVFSNPFATLTGWIANLIPDISIVLFTSWFKTLNPEYIFLARPFNALLVTFLALVFILGVLYIRSLHLISSTDEGWSKQALALGLPSLVLGILPFYFATYSMHLTETPHNSRLAIGMLPGAAIVSVAIFEKMISKEKFKIGLLALAICLAIGWHIHYSNDYRKEWEYQSGFLRQLTWRVPGLEDGTALYVWKPTEAVVENADARIVLAEFSMSMAVNSIYQTAPLPENSRLSYWYYDLGGSTEVIPQGVDLHSEHATTYFDGNTSRRLFFYYDPVDGRCLRLVDGEDQAYKQYPDAIKNEALQASNSMQRVLPKERQNVELRDQILEDGRRPWCFYYQKADLARQFEQWEQIPELWQQVMAHGLRSSFGTEYLPFIDGFAHVGNWQAAGEITLRANRISKAMNSALCPLWDEIEQDTPDSGERMRVLEQLRSDLKCPAR